MNNQYHYQYRNQYEDYKNVHGPDEAFALTVDEICTCFRGDLRTIADLVIKIHDQYENDVRDL